MSFFTNDFSEEVWDTTYRYNGETIEGTWRRVAKAIASVEEPENRRVWEDNFYDLLYDFKVLPGGRITANAGTEYKATLINCFVSPKTINQPDSLVGILETLQHQSLTLKSEGGWGHNFSAIRPRGAYIKTLGVESPGPVKFMELFDKSSEIITSGSGKEKGVKGKKKIRKGAQMGVLDIWHPSIVEFITAKQTSGRLGKFNLSVNTCDAFMDQVKRVKSLRDEGASEEQISAITWDLIFPDTEHYAYDIEWDGDLDYWTANGYGVEIYETVSVAWLWDLITKSTFNRNEPGLLFLDRANHYNPLSYYSKVYSHKGEKIRATNPCQPEFATVMTPFGIREFKDVEEGSIIWSGERWTTVTRKWSTGVKSVYKYGTRAGYFLGTKNHRILSEGEKIEVGEADSIDISYQKNILTGSVCNPQDIMDGLVIGDGYIHKASDNLPLLVIGDKDTDYHTSEINYLIKEHRPGVRDKSWEIFTTVEKSLEKRTYERTIPEEFYKGDFNKVCGFLRGLFSANGSLAGTRVTLKQTSFTLIQQVQEMLSFLGIRSYYTVNKSKEIVWYNGAYTSKQSYDINITGGDRYKFRSLIGFIQKYKTEKLNELLSKEHKELRKKLTYEIVDTEYIGEFEVFDITVDDDSHTYWTGGLLVSNCGEQTLAPAGVCCLGTLNLTKFVLADGSGFDLEKIAKYSGYLARFLDNVNTYSDAPLPEYKKSMVEKRRIGCGVMGWGSALYMIKTRYASVKAEKIKKELMSVFTTSIVRTSIDLAKEKGMFTLCDPYLHQMSPFWSNINLPREMLKEIAKYGIRNSSLFSMQPNGNGGVFVNLVTGGGEPCFSHEYTRTSIVQTASESIRKLIPNYLEGEFHETEVFKYVKEGDETLLRGEVDGVVYKIDKNRGLLKETLCTDYGVHFLKEKGEWDPSAEWAVTAQNLTVEDHINDLKGFAIFCDSAVSKTVNIPNEYSFENFQNIYLDAYNTGYIKGVTTYRAGTMANVLSTSEEEDEIILQDVKLPDSSEAVVKILRADNKKWYLTVVSQDGKPFALFVRTNNSEKNVSTSDALDRLFSLASLKGIPEEYVESTKKKCENDSNSDKIARAISLLLRHGVKIVNIVSELDKVEEVFAGSFLFQVKKFLSTYIKDGEKVKGVCANCKSTKLIYSEGCSKCLDCGGSKCG